MSTEPLRRRAVRGRCWLHPLSSSTTRCQWLSFAPLSRESWNPMIILFLTDRTWTETRVSTKLPLVVWRTNRKSHTRLLSIGTKIIDLGWPWTTLNGQYALWCTKDACFVDDGNFWRFEWLLLRHFRDTASNIIWRYATPCRPVIDCKMNDLEWPWVAISCQNPFSVSTSWLRAFDFQK